jgi:RNA-directed DNA polymerase
LKKTFYTRTNRIGGGKRMRYPLKVNYVRYADDFVITGCSKELLENQVKPVVREFLKARGLELSEEKTRVTHVEEGFDFLGWNVRKYKGKLLIKPSKDNVKAFLRKVRTIVETNKTMEQANLIKRLNPVLRGWANYHKHVVSSKTFSYVDHQIWRKLWQWSKRRHPNKGIKWVKNKYFPAMPETRQWVFAASVRNKGRAEMYKLYFVNSTKIVRHVQIRDEASPFDPKWELYFERRNLSKLAEGMAGQKVKQWILKKQEGKCPICGQMLGESYHIHHKVWKVFGGDKLGAANLLLVHETCHKQIHSQGYSVAKPAAA